MLNNDTYLMVAIFQKLMRVNENKSIDPACYIEDHLTGIKEAGELLKYLGLAVPDETSPINWRPTHHLMEVIAERLSRKQKPVPKRSDGEELLLDLLRDTVFKTNGNEDNDNRSPSNKGKLGFDVLQAIGLIRSTEHGRQSATKKLQRLFSENYGTELFYEID